MKSNKGYIPSHVFKMIWENDSPQEEGNFDVEKEKVERRKREHLKKVKKFLDKKNVQREYIPCLHDSCPNCLGTGITLMGQMCVHYISCKCPKCSPMMVRW